MDKSSLKIVGVFSVILAAILAYQNQNQPQTKSKPKPEVSKVIKVKPRLTSHKDTSNQFTIETRVSVADPNQNND
jgi:hypothetical protein